MVVSENIRIAFRALRANKMRSMLTTLGIIIGVAAVIAVVSIVQGLQFMITKELQGVGATYVMVMPKHDQNQGPGVIARQVKLTWEDGEAIREKVQGIRLITPLIVGSGAAAQVRRAAAHDDDPRGEPGLAGGEQSRGGARTLLLAPRHGAPPQGRGDRPEGGGGAGAGPTRSARRSTSASLPVSIIGVMEKRGQALGQDSDDLAFIPFDTAVNLLGRTAGEAIQLRLQAEDASVVDQVKDGITQTLRQRHKIAEGQPNDFDVMLQDEILKTVGSILGMITTVVGARRRRRPPGRRHRHHEHHAGLA